MDSDYEKADRLFRSHIKELKPYVFDLSKKNLSYIKALGIVSATIGSFSFLALQTSPSVLNVNKILLVHGFLILVINVFISFLIMRIWIDIEERPVNQSLESLELEEETKKILRNLTDEGRVRLSEIVSQVELFDGTDKSERNIQKLASNLLGGAIYGNIIIFAWGLFTLLSALN